jgi:hypothetical protein
VGLEGSAGAWGAAARVQAGETIDRAMLDTAGFRFLKVDDIYSLDFLPGGAKYGDLPGMLTAAAPGAIWLAGEDDASIAGLKSAYESAGQPDRLTIGSGKGDALRQAALEWLCK